jgi:hypothetical protein
VIACPANLILLPSSSSSIWSLCDAQRDYDGACGGVASPLV